MPRYFRSAWCKHLEGIRLYQEVCNYIFHYYLFILWFVKYECNVSLNVEILKGTISEVHYQKDTPPIEKKTKLLCPKVFNIMYGMYLNISDI